MPKSPPRPLQTLHRIIEKNKPPFDRVLHFFRTSNTWSMGLFFVFFFYEELLLRTAADGSFFGLGLLYILLFSLFLGMIVRAVLLAFSPKVRQYAYPIGGFVLCLVYMTEYFLKRSFRSFMSLTSIQTGAEDMVGGFGELIVATALRGFFMIVLFSLPLILYFILLRSYRPKLLAHKQRTIMPLIAAGALILASVLCLGISKDRHLITDEYHFDSCVSRIGLSPALAVDLFHTHAVGNDTFTLAQYEALEEEAPVYGPTLKNRPEYNRIDADFSARAQAEKNDIIRSIDEYVASSRASQKNKYTGLFKGKNLILITAEAFSAEVIDKERTPTLYRMATRGIVFEDYYQPAWGGSTSTGEYSVMTGLIPTAGVKSMKNTIGVDMAYTIGNQLRREGYYSAAYHNGNYTYYGRNETHCNLGYDSFTGIGNGLEKGIKIQWPQSDLEMIDYTVPQYIDKQPFSIYYMTVSGHCLYDFGNAMAKKNQALYDDLDAAKPIRAYLAAQQELEFAMESLLAQLKEKSLLDDTVIVISTDHYPYGLEHSEAWRTDRDYLVDLYGQKADTPFVRDHSALIMWSGCLEKHRPLVVDTPTYSVDILPTLSNLFGVTYDSRLLVGRDVFSDQDPLVIFIDYSFITDKGRYLASTGVFTPNDGAEIPEGYVEQMKTVVKNKMTFSKNVIASNYYHTLP